MLTCGSCRSIHVLKLNLVSQAFLELPEFQEFWYRTGHYQNWVWLGTPGHNRVKELYQFIGGKNAYKKPTLIAQLFFDIGFSNNLQPD